MRRDNACGGGGLAEARDPGKGPGTKVLLGQEKEPAMGTEGHSEPFKDFK